MTNVYVPVGLDSLISLGEKVTIWVKDDIVWALRRPNGKIYLHNMESRPVALIYNFTICIVLIPFFGLGLFMLRKAMEEVSQINIVKSMKNQFPDAVLV